MKLSFIVFLLAGMLSASALEWPLAQVNVEVARPDDPVQKLAGEEMRKHLALIAGPPQSGTRYRFLIGTPAPGGETTLERTGARYAVRGDKVYFWGDDAWGGSLTADRTRCGTLSAVYAFLENELGVKWIRPTDAGIVCEPRQVLQLPESKDYRWSMPYLMTGVRVYWWRNRLIQPENKFTPEKLRLSEAEVDERQNQDHLWFRRMRHGKRSDFKYGHAFGGWWKKYGEEHPEYFGLDESGRRGLPERLRGREKLCLSNPEVIDVVIREWEAAGKPEYWNICPNDGTPGFCHCEKCMALDARRPGEDFLAHLTDRYLWFWNRVAERAVKLRPDVKLITYVYSYYRHPPRREKVEYPDNLILGMVPQMFENNDEFFGAWAKAGAKNIFLRPNDLCSNTPYNRGLEKRIYDKFQAANRFKIFGTDYDGSCGVRNIDLEYYIAARMMHDPSRSFDELENEYCSAYGAAAPDVLDYYRHWRKTGEQVLARAIEVMQKENRRLNDAGQLGALLNRNIAFFIPEEDFQKGAAMLQSAAKKELTPQARRLLDELIVIDRHSYLSWAFMNQVNLKQQKKPNRAEEAARELVAFREKNRDLIGWSWPNLFASPRAEKAGWESIDWYCADILGKPRPQPKDPNQVFSHNFDNGKLNGWKKREAFKEIAPRPDGDGFCMAFTAGAKYAMGASLHGLKAAPGTYRLSAEYCLPGKAEYIRFRIVGDNQTLLNLIERRRDDRWTTCTRDFTVPAGIKTLTVYVIAGSGDGGPIYLDNISLSRVDAGTEDAI